MRRILRSLALAFLLLAAPAAGQVVDVVFPGYRVFVAANDSTLSTHQTYHVALERAVNFAIATGRATRIELVGPVRVTVDPSQVPVPDPDEPDEPDDPADTVPTPDPDPQPEPDPDPPPDVQPPPPSTGTAWYEQDWAYSSTAQMLAAPDIGDATYPAGGSVSLLTGLSNTPGGFTTAMRATYFGNREKPQAGVDITLPQAGTDKPREVWVEFFTRFSPNWTTLGPYSGGADHKFFFMFDQNPDGNWRWENMVGTFGTNIQVMIGGGGHGIGQAGLGDLWNGQWHRMRYHARMDATNGLFTLTVDNNSPIGFTGENTNRGSQYYFKYVALSRNLNRGTAATQWVDFGPVSVYRVDPGW